jgi:ATP adenylyltransferase
LEHLWSPWRLQYVIGSKTKPGCVFCGPARIAEPDSLIVHEGKTGYVILNLYPYNNGHLMIVPWRHEPTLAGLTAEEMNELGRLTQLSERALREAFRLDGINVGVNLGQAAGAGIIEHVHVHLVPRWSGDANFMTVVGQTRVLPETLEQTAARMRPIFARLGRAVEGVDPDP